MHFFGLSLRKKGWKVFYLDTQKVFFSRDIYVEETVFPFASNLKNKNSTDGIDYLDSPSSAWSLYKLFSALPHSPNYGPFSLDSNSPSLVSSQCNNPNPIASSLPTTASSFPLGSAATCVSLPDTTRASSFSRLGNIVRLGYNPHATQPLPPIDLLFWTLTSLLQTFRRGLKLPQNPKAPVLHGSQRTRHLSSKLKDYICNMVSCSDTLSNIPRSTVISRK